MKTTYRKRSHALCGLMLGLLTLSAGTLPTHGGTIDWGANWSDATDSGTYLVDGITINISTTPGVITVQTQPFLTTKKGPIANQTYVITFSEPVDFSLSIGHLNAPGESAGNFSTAPSSVIVNPLHSWDGATLSYNGSDKPPRSILTWSGITSLSYDHIHIGTGTGALIEIDDSEVTRAVTDTDGDGVPDDEDAFPDDPFESEDTDEDGIGNNADECDESDLGLTVVIGGIDTFVMNQLFDDGCTIADLINRCAGVSFTHGDFVSCVAHKTNDLKKEGVISGKEKGAIMKAAAKVSWYPN